MNVAYPFGSSVSDAFERPAFEESTFQDQRNSSSGGTPDSGPVLVFTETEAQLGYSSTGYNNATISINQVSPQKRAISIRYTGIDK